MRLFVERHSVLDGQFHQCFSWPVLTGTLSRHSRSRLLRRIRRNQRRQYGFRQFYSQQEKIFCTPRCYVTKNWEVGYYQSYRFDAPRDRLVVTSDFHLLQVIDQLNVYLHAMDIRTTRGSRFLLTEMNSPGQRYRLPKWLNRIFREYHPQSHFIVSLVMEFLSLVYQTPTAEKLSSVLSQLEMARDRYFIVFEASETNFPMDSTLRKYYQKMFGYLYGVVLGQIRGHGLAIRQYIRYEDALITVSILPLCYV